MKNGFFLFLIIIGCHRNVETNNGLTTESFVENEIWQPKIVITRKEVKVVDASSEKLLKNTNEDALLIGNVKVDFYNDAGEHLSILYSDSARINNKNNNLYATGNVIVISDSGYTLSAKELLWDNQYKLIVSKDSIMFTSTQEDTMYGVGFESDMDLTHIRIFRPHGSIRKGLGE